MRRLLASLLALALCALAASPGVADEDEYGTLVVVSNGPGEGTFHAPSEFWTTGGPAMTGTSPFLVLGVGTSARTHLGVVRAPGARYEWKLATSTVPRGRTTVRMLTRGPTTLRLPVRGFAGTRTVRLDRPFRGGTGVIRTLQPREVHVVEDAIPFTTSARSVVVHGFVRPSLVAAYAGNSCVTFRGGSCGSVPGPGTSVMDYERVAVYRDWLREGDGVLRFAQVVASSPKPVTHFLFVLPMP